MEITLKTILTMLKALYTLSAVLETLPTIEISIKSTTIIATCAIINTVINVMKFSKKGKV